MATNEELQEEFDEFSIQLDDLCIIDELKEISNDFNWDARKLVEEWMAFSAGSNIYISLESLKEFKRKKSSDRRSRSNVVKKTESRNATLYNKNNIDEFITDQDVGMLQQYQTPETNTAIKRLHTTPESGMKMLRTLSGRTPTSFPSVVSSPASATPAKRYEARENAGEVVLTYNPGGVSVENMSWKGHHQNVTIRSVDDEPLTERYKFMFQKSLDKSQVLNKHIDKMALILKEAHKIEKFATALSIHQDDVAIVGQICCDTNGRLNARSLVLRESGSSSSGHAIPLSVGDVDQYSLFPGQVVAVKGTNSAGTQFIASSFYEGIVPQPHQLDSSLSDDLMLFVTAGPFTTSESILYEPLTDFLNVVQEQMPDIVIMIGPFVDAKHELIEKCELEVSFQELFSRQMRLISDIAKSLKTKFIIIPSLRDVNHDCVYPQPPFCFEDIVNNLVNIKNTKNTKDERKPLMGLNLLSDPCTIKVNGFTLGITSTDVLFHMGSEEITNPPGSSDKMGRLVKHILTQQCYYPMYPPSEDVCVDYEAFFKHARLPCKPDVLIVPSDLRYFAKNVMGCLSINPGRLAKGLVGGSYSRILLKKDPGCQDVVDQSVVEIVRI